jgi:predicted O-linked N-acetylglucosamine transferase (SPINDLY family)
VNPKSSLELRFSAAAQCHRAGRLAEAERLYRQIIAVDRRHFQSFYFLGMLMSQLGRGDAVDLLRQAARLKPDFAEVHNDLGTVLLAKGSVADAVAAFRRAVELKPSMVIARQNLGNALRESGDLDGAIVQFERALVSQPGNAGTHVLLGNALARRGDREAAAEHYRRALRLDPKLAVAHYSLAALSAELGRLDDAAAGYRRAIALAPNFADAHNNLAGILKELGDLDGAVAHLRRALVLQPSAAGISNNLGNMLSLVGKVDEAIAAYRRAIDLDQGFASAHYNLGLALESRSRLDFTAAAAAFARASAVDPSRLDAKLALGIAELPILYDDEAMIRERRAAYAGHLAGIRAEVEREPRLLARIADAARAQYPFFLPYQGGNDRELQSVYGGLVCRAMAGRYPRAPLPRAPQPGERVRVGFVSGFFNRHTVWKLLTKGWMGQLDRGRFEVLGYHTGPDRDAETEAAAALCDRFVQGQRSIDRWRDVILADAPHVLVYPDIGMDLTAVQLAAQRLARIQCVAWGHPETTGFPTVDYFLSSELMEPQDGEAHYSERLVRLPNLSIYYEPLAVGDVGLTRAELGLRDSAILFWSAQTLTKYLPQYDQVFPRIAQAVPDCQFVFVAYPGAAHVTERFRDRLAASFASFGLAAAAHCAFLPRLSPERFVAAAGLADIGLDTIGWSGGNSTLEALARDLPIVTLPGPLMRGRHTAAILQRIGVGETIAATLDDYVRLAVELARDPDRRRRLAATIAERRHLLYRDRACIAALEDFLDRAVRLPDSTPAGCRSPAAEPVA